MIENILVKKDSEFKDWLSGIPYELAFWNNVFRWTSTFNSMMRWSRYNKNLELDGMDVSVLLKDSENPIVLDIGCGLSFANGDRLSIGGEEKKIDVHYIDPLADFYNVINRRHKRHLPNIEFGIMEHISSTWNCSDVTLCIICNALDHSSSPIKGIMEALKVLKIGGRLYLNHHPNEAETENYKGFHKFNICIDEQKRLIIWNRQERVIVNDLLAGYAEIETKTLDNGFVVAIITKIADIPNNTGQEYNTEHLRSLIQATSNTLSFKIKYQWYNIIQFFVQSLSWDKKQKLKRLIKV